MPASRYHTALALGFLTAVTIISVTLVILWYTYLISLYSQQRQLYPDILANVVLHIAVRERHQCIVYWFLQLTHSSKLPNIFTYY